MRVRTTVAGLLVVVFGAMTLAGCGPKKAATVAITYSRSTTAMEIPTMGAGGAPVPLLRWSSADQLVLTTWGSGSCPLLPTAVTLINAHRITIALDSDGGACTADFAPTNSIILAP